MSLLKQDHPRDALVAELARCVASRLNRGGSERIVIWKAIEEVLMPAHARFSKARSHVASPQKNSRTG